MRQLEEMLGTDELREGLREYLTRFAFANATWADSDCRFSTERTDEDLAAWSSVWVDEPGRPTIATDLQSRVGQDFPSVILAIRSRRTIARSGIRSFRLRSATNMAHGSTC